MTSVLSVDNIVLNFDGLRALDGFLCELSERRIHGLIGPNGSGKTTLFNVITGFLKPDAGRVSHRGRNLVGGRPWRIARHGVVRSFQTLRLLDRMTVRENVLLCFQNQQGERLTGLFTHKKQERQLVSRANELLEFMGIMDRADVKADEISYGQRKLLSLACCLATDPDVLLLDEPVAGVHPVTIKAILERLSQLRDRGVTIFLIEHNLDAVFDVADHVYVMAEGRLRLEGPPSQIRGTDELLEAYL